MDSKSMEQAMLKNMVQKTGKSIEGWIQIINKQNFVANKDIVKFLKEVHSIGHFYAHLIAKKQNQ
tara:strand:- start:58 stop:252 length:195 start_codon:yes stop_codon:yes gene_type:complete